MAKRIYRCTACGLKKQMTSYGKYPSALEHLRSHHLVGVPASFREVTDNG